MQKDIELLGFKTRDAITGFKGVVSSISFDLQGCVMGLVVPEVDKKTGKRGDAEWFDTKRLIITDRARVMPLPTFASIPGGQALPQYRSQSSS